jgi:hypothetical protein
MVWFVIGCEIRALSLEITQVDVKVQAHCGGVETLSLGSPPNAMVIDVSKSRHVTSPLGMVFVFLAGEEDINFCFASLSPD